MLVHCLRCAIYCWKGNSTKCIFGWKKSKGSSLLNGCIKYLDNTVFIQNILCQLWRCWSKRKQFCPLMAAQQLFCLTRTIFLHIRRCSVFVLYLECHNFNVLWCYIDIVYQKYVKDQKGSFLVPNKSAKLAIQYYFKEICIKKIKGT